MPSFLLWKAVKQIDWPKLCKKYRDGDEDDDDYDTYDDRPYNRGREILVKNGWTDYVIKQAREELYILSGCLKEMWHDEAKSLKIGDDSWSDLINHVIGCGPEVILGVIDNPRLLHLYNKEKEESFAYCFHTPDKN